MFVYKNLYRRNESKILLPYCILENFIYKNKLKTHFIYIIKLLNNYYVLFFIIVYYYFVVYIILC